MEQAEGGLSRRRLLGLLSELPTPVLNTIQSDARLDPIRSRLIAEDEATTLQAQLRVLRNQLSHGQRNYPDDELDPWVAAVEVVCRARVLALLRFSASDIEKALGNPAGG